MPRLSGARTQPSLAERAPQPRPFLKWAGGKAQLLEQFSLFRPARFGRYFEPFVGGAAFFFALQPDKAILTDVNKELIDCYRAVRDEVEAVIDALGKHRYGSERYYEVRGIDPWSLPLAERAARTIYLNKTGFNGLYRVNRAGKFNVPMGRYTNPLFCDPVNLRACSNALRGVKLHARTFQRALAGARQGDFVYFDPPYVPISDTADFTSYVPGGFGPEQQRALARLFSDLARKDVYVMLSNSDTPEVRKLYEGFQIDGVFASRSINSNGARRGKVGEVIVRNFVAPTDAPNAKSAKGEGDLAAGGRGGTRLRMK